MMKSRDARPASQKAPWRGGLLALAPAAARERKPPSQQGLSPCWPGGLLALGFSSTLTLNSSIGECFFWFVSSCLLQIEVHRKSLRGWKMLTEL